MAGADFLGVHMVGAGLATSSFVRAHTRWSHRDCLRWTAPGGCLQWFSVSHPTPQLEVTPGAHISWEKPAKGPAAPTTSISAAAVPQPPAPTSPHHGLALGSDKHDGEMDMTLGCFWQNHGCCTGGIGFCDHTRLTCFSDCLCSDRACIQWQQSLAASTPITREQTFTPDRATIATRERGGPAQHPL